jgi:hypothetical protein
MLFSAHACPALSKRICEVLAPGNAPGRIPRLPGPAGEAGAVGQGVRVLGVRHPLEDGQRGELIADDKLTLSYVVRHLDFAEMAAGRLDGARELLEESVRLRREIGLTRASPRGCSRWLNWPPGRRTVTGHWHCWMRRQPSRLKQDPAMERPGRPRTMTSVPDNRLSAV